MPHTTHYCASIAALYFASTSFGQGFGSQQVITTGADGAWCVQAVDLDNDGDADVVYTSRLDDTVAWRENLGGGLFGPEHVVDSSVDGASFVKAADIDGDGDPDLVSTSTFADAVTWYENRLNSSGVLSFGPPQVINMPGLSTCCGAYGLDLADLDSDGDVDVLVTFDTAGEITWFENVGIGGGAAGGLFASKRIIASTTCASGVIGMRVDDDADVDVVFSDHCSSLVQWSRNQGGQVFAPPQSITGSAQWPHSLISTDMDGDGDLDLVVGSRNDDKVAWYENDGAGVFSAEQIISTNADWCTSVFALDLDGDGDPDILSASEGDNKVAWYENLGNGSFGTEQVISTDAVGARFVCAADLDGDGDADVLSASYSDDKIAWYENLTPLIDCNQNGVQDSADIANGTSNDCNGNGLPDECEIAIDCSLDLNLNGILDSCECLSENFCLTSPSTVGPGAIIGVGGIPSLSVNLFSLRAAGLPPGQPGVFYFGDFPQDPPLPFGNGWRCVGGNTVRLNPPIFADPQGNVIRELDFSIAPGNAFVAGETRYFQFWYRDHPQVGATFNLTDAIAVTICP